MKTLPSLLLAFGFAIVARAQEPQLFDVTPAHAGGIVISVQTKADGQKRLDEMVKLGAFSQAEAQAKKEKLPAIEVHATITRKSAAAARPSNFAFVITDAEGKEVANHSGKDEHQEINFGGKGVNTFFTVGIAKGPVWPLKVEVKDALNGKSGVFSIEPRKAK